VQIGKRSERLLIGEPKGDPTSPWRVIAYRLHYASQKRTTAICGEPLSGSMPWEAYEKRRRLKIRICPLCVTDTPLPADLPRPGWYRHDDLLRVHYFKGLVASCSDVIFHAEQGWKRIMPPQVTDPAICTRCHVLALGDKVAEATRQIKGEAKSENVREQYSELDLAIRRGIRFSAYIENRLTSNSVIDTLMSNQAIETQGLDALKAYAPAPGEESVRAYAYTDTMPDSDTEKLQLLLDNPRYVNAVLFRLVCNLIADRINLTERTKSSLRAEIEQLLQNERKRVYLFWYDIRADRLLLLKMQAQLAAKKRDEQTRNAAFMYDLVGRALNSLYAV